MDIKYYWKEGRIEFLDGADTLNANDVLWHKLHVEIIPAFTKQRLFAVFSNAETGEHTHEIFVADNKEEASFEIPKEIIRVGGEWSLTLFAREYDTTNSSYIQKASDPVKFFINGLYRGEDGSPITSASIANLYAAVLENADGAAKSAAEAEACMQALATNQPNNSEAGLVGSPTVSIEQADDGSRRFKFANLKGEQGQQGIQGDKGDKGDKGEKGEKGEVGYIEIVRLI